MNLSDATYKKWLIELKSKIRSVQIKAAMAVNSALIEFYWELGGMICERQTAYGTGFIPQLSKDLQEEFKEMKGLSVRNLAFCRQFYQFYSFLNLQQPVANSSKLTNTKGAISDLDSGYQFILQIPWGHNILIFTKSKNLLEAHFYIQKTIENNWSRDNLALQIKTDLYKRNGKAVSNFKNTLPEPLSELAQQTLKDPYIFDFMAFAADFRERDIEKQLVEHISKFLLELGKGFAFVGQQYHLGIAGNDYYMDLLFYHIKLKCYVVIELKNTKFIPEYAGKLNFYLSAVDTLLKQSDDKATIGILLCRDKNNIEAEFALRGIDKPMGVSEFQITENLPENLKSSLPTIEEIENEFKNLENEIK